MQRYEIINGKIRERFEQLRKDHPEQLKERLKLSWNSCLFGFEEYERSIERLARYNVLYVELGGNWGGTYEDDDPEELLALFSQYPVSCGGICGLFSDNSNLSSPDRFVRGRAKEYIIHEIEMCKKLGGEYLLIVPGRIGAVGRYDSNDVSRAAKGLRQIAPVFQENGIKCALETVNSMETQIVNNIAETIDFIQEVNIPGFGHINGDLYHMLLEEKHIGQAILNAGDYLVNLHLADSNRQPIGEGCLDIDTVIRALYIIGYNLGRRFVTAEPIGLGRHMSELLTAKHDPAWLDERVRASTEYFREREEAVLAGL